MTSSRALGIAAFIALATVVVALQVQRDRTSTSDAAVEQSLYVSSPAFVTRAALSFDAIVADVYWIRAVQYYGQARLERRMDARYDLLYPLLELTTSLDPQFMIPYTFGAFFMAERAPGGAGRPDLSEKLLSKGMAANPTRWEYPYNLGFVYYRQADYPRAAEWFQRAARVAGAPNWVAPLAAVTLATGGDVRSSRFLWQNILSNAQESWLRRTAQQRLVQLEAVDQVARLTALTAAYEKRHGDPPTTWDDLVRDGALRRVPLDPAGVPYALNPWWGIVDVSEQSPLWPLPVNNPR